MTHRPRFADLNLGESLELNDSEVTLIVNLNTIEHLLVLNEEKEEEEHMG